jgi:hypothetical protein
VSDEVPHTHHNPRVAGGPALARRVTVADGRRSEFETRPHRFDYVAPPVDTTCPLPVGLPWPEDLGDVAS